MHQHTTSHWPVVKHILRYLKSTINHGLIIYKGSLSMLHDLSDANWVGNSDDHCLISDLLSSLAPTSFLGVLKSRRLLLAPVWNAFGVLGLHLQYPPWLWRDNLLAIYRTANPISHARTKHTEIDYRFVREHVLQKQLDIRFISLTVQLDDVLTKGLPTSRLSIFYSKFNICNLHCACGRIIDRIRSYHDQIISW